MQLTVRDVAQLFKVSERQVYKWIAREGLPAYRVHEQYRCNRAELLDWATARQLNISSQLFHERVRVPSSHLGSARASLFLVCGRRWCCASLHPCSRWVFSSPLWSGELEKPSSSIAGAISSSAKHAALTRSSISAEGPVVFFMLAGREAGSLDLDKFSPVSSATASVLFLLAVIGFGTKAGFWPLHVWLPEAHPAAPSHVSAVMSGVMIKTGIYGLVRALTVMGTPPLWWGWLLIAVGGISGVLGVLFALAQHDLKRLLAYHSVENIGIIALGLGVGLVELRLCRDCAHRSSVYRGWRWGVRSGALAGVWRALDFRSSDLYPRADRL